jgi:hypothetical protein
MRMAQLGDRVKDPISGFTGIATSITTWLHGCIRLGVVPEKLDKDGKPKDDRYFDQTQLVVLKEAVHKPMMLDVIEAPPEVRKSRGGPSRERPAFKK